MSIDFRIQNLCDHRILWERVSLGTDGKTLISNYPIAAGSSVSVRINGIELGSGQFFILIKPNQFISSIKERYVYLSRRNRDYLPLIELNYVTNKENCPKCYGGTALDDIKYDNNGDITTAKDELLLLQTVEKYIVTRVSSNSFHKWMGTSLHDLLSSKILDIDTIRLEVINQINLAISKLKQMQTQHINTGRQLSSGELFGDLIGVELERAEEDPTLIKVFVRFTARSGKSLQYEQLLEFAQTRERVAF